jgi:hypothetical protein
MERAIGRAAFEFAAAANIDHHFQRILLVKGASVTDRVE